VPPPKPDKSKAIIVAGITCGCLLFIALVAYVWPKVYKKRQNEVSPDDLDLGKLQGVAPASSRRVKVGDELTMTLQRHAKVLSSHAADKMEMGTLVAAKPPPLVKQKSARKILRRGNSGSRQDVKADGPTARSQTPQDHLHHRKQSPSTVVPMQAQAEPLSTCFMFADVEESI